LFACLFACYRCNVDNLTYHKDNYKEGIEKEKGDNIYKIGREFESPLFARTHVYLCDFFFFFGSVSFW